MFGNVVHHYFNYEVYIKQFYLKYFEANKDSSIELLHK